MNHTPSPWMLRRAGRRRTYLDNDLEVCVDGNGIIASIYEENWPHGQNDANAHLIAAAPDLLAACELLVASDVSDFHSESDEEWACSALDEAIKRAREAIAKAQNRPPSP